MTESITNLSNDYLHISMSNSILTVSVTDDVFDSDQTQPTKQFFIALFNTFDTSANSAQQSISSSSDVSGDISDDIRPIRDQNSASRTFACIFDIHLLSSINLYRYVKEFKPFFYEHRQVLHRVIHASSVVIDSTLVRTIIAPIINFISTGRPFAFTKNIEDANEFVFQYTENL